MIDLMKGFPMDKGFTNMVIHGSPAILLAMYIAAAEELGYSPDQLRGSGKNDPFQSHLAERIELLPIEAELQLCMDILEFCTDKMPKWNPISVSGFSYHPAGLNSIQELGLTLASAIAYIQAGVQRGLKCDDFAHRISFFMSGGIDFLEEIAKFRAARRLWARIMKDKFGATNPSHKSKINAFPGLLLNPDQRLHGATAIGESCQRDDPGTGGGPGRGAGPWDSMLR